MSILIETEQALAELPADHNLGQGIHFRSQVRTGTDGQIIGWAEYDPSRHYPGDIDPTAIMRSVTGQDYVREVLPHKPLNINVVTDFTTRNEHPSITDAKQALGADLLRTLYDARPDFSDRIYAHALGNDDRMLTNERLNLLADEEDGPEVMSDEIANLAKKGLTFVISDFRRLQFESGTNLNSLIGIKVNHPAERKIPAGMGFVSLGGEVELNTNDATQLEYVNHKLEEDHNKIISRLRHTGAVAVSVVVAPHNPALYDTVTFDLELAEAVREVSNHKRFA